MGRQASRGWRGRKDKWTLCGKKAKAPWNERKIEEGNIFALSSTKNPNPEERAQLPSKAAFHKDIWALDWHDPIQNIEFSELSLLPEKLGFGLNQEDASACQRPLRVLRVIAAFHHRFKRIFFGAKTWPLLVTWAKRDGKRDKERPSFLHQIVPTMGWKSYP